MDMAVLVAYGSRHGATAGIAEKVGEVLRQAGLRVDVLPAEQVKDLQPYQAVVLGSGVYAGQWHKQAARFLTAHEQALAARPVWLFSSGPTGQGDPVQLLKGWLLPEALRPVAERIKARDTALFHGALDLNKVSLPEKIILKAMKANLGDFRDWQAITAWAAGIAEELKK